MLKNLIHYYANVSDMAIDNLKNEKRFQFKKHLTNHSLLRVVESHYDKITSSPAARKMTADYMARMEGMYKVAKTDYNSTLQLMKATTDPIAKQRIIDSYAEKGIHGFTAKNGAKWNIETYSNMVTTHFNNELVRLSVMETLSPNSKVRISYHAKACPLCVPYEDKVMTLEEMETARSNGLYHVRCKHFFTEVKP